MKEGEIPAIKQPNDQEQLFIDSYLTHGQKARAARDAKYSELCDRQTGYAVYNRPHVKAHIEKILEERTISAAETLKIVSDMAEFDMADYFVPVKRIQYVKVKQPLSVSIDHIKEEIIKKQKFIERAGLTEQAYDDAMSHIASMERDIIRHEIELESDPDAYEIVTDAKLVEVMELDIDAVVKDKSRGKVKSVKYTKDGIQLEGYDALSAARDLLKVHGKFEKDNDQKRDVIHINVNNDDAKLGS